MRTPSTTREVMVPAEYKDVAVQKLVSPAEADAGSDSRRATERHEDGCGERRSYRVAAGALRNQRVPCGDQINAASPSPGGALPRQDRRQAEPPDDGRRPFFPAGKRIAYGLAHDRDAPSSRSKNRRLVRSTDGLAETKAILPNGDDTEWHDS